MMHYHVRDKKDGRGIATFDKRKDADAHVRRILDAKYQGKRRHRGNGASTLKDFPVSRCTCGDLQPLPAWMTT